MGMKQSTAKRIKLAGLSTLTLALMIALVGCTAAAEDALSKYQGPVSTGTVEGTEVDINSKLPGKISEILVQEGDQVKAGQVIARLSTDELKAKEKQAQALVDAAKSQWDQAETAVKLQEKIANSNVERAQGALTAAQAQADKAERGARTQEVAQAQAAYDLMLSTFQRVEKLYQKGAVPAQKYDEVKTQLEVAKETLSMAKEGARSEDVRAAQGLVLQAQGAYNAALAGRAQVDLAKQTAAGAKAKYEQALGGLQEVQAYLKDAELKAPMDGTVTTLYADAGELISTGMPIATVTDIQHMWIEVKVKESDLNKIKIHGQVLVALDNGSQKPMPGKVVRISKKPDFATKRATNDRGEQDILAYGVKVELAGKPGLVPGLSAQVKFVQSKS